MGKVLTGELSYTQTDLVIFAALSTGVEGGEEGVGGAGVNS